MYDNDLHVLVVAPTGRDSTLIADLLMKEGINCSVCRNSEEALERIEGSGARWLLKRYLSFEHRPGAVKFPLIFMV